MTRPSLTMVCLENQAMGVRIASEGWAVTLLLNKEWWHDLEASSAWDRRLWWDSLDLVEEGSASRIEANLRYVLSEPLQQVQGDYTGPAPHVWLKVAGLGRELEPSAGDAFEAAFFAASHQFVGRDGTAPLAGVLTEARPDGFRLLQVEDEFFQCDRRCPNRRLPQGGDDDGILDVEGVGGVLGAEGGAAIKSDAAVLMLEADGGDAGAAGRASALGRHLPEEQRRVPPGVENFHSTASPEGLDADQGSASRPAGETRPAGEPENLP